MPSVLCSWGDNLRTGCLPWLARWGRFVFAMRLGRFPIVCVFVACAPLSAYQQAQRLSTASEAERIDALHASDWRIAATAAQELSKARSTDSARALSECVEWNVDWRVQAYCATALGELAPLLPSASLRAAVAALRSCSTSGRESLREICAENLTKCEDGDGVATPAVTETMPEPVVAPAPPVNPVVAPPVSASQCKADAEPGYYSVEEGDVLWLVNASASEQKISQLASFLGTTVNEAGVGLAEANCARIASAPANVAIFKSVARITQNRYVVLSGRRDQFGVWCATRPTDPMYARLANVLRLRDFYSASELPTCIGALVPPNR